MALASGIMHRDYPRINHPNDGTLGFIKLATLMMDTVPALGHQPGCQLIGVFIQTVLSLIMVCVGVRSSPKSMSWHDVTVPNMFP